ncbi:ABC transporter permease subunit, partial [Candidatus Micrarchaeota archaeon]|nr:ABC transporter permease subunit [Candidatus Micrarchaeota archaeon]
MQKTHFAIFILIIAIAAIYYMGNDAAQFPYLMFRTFIRMLAAYLLALIFSISLGLFVAHNEKAFKILFPVLDILQSVPILGFLPFAVLFIIHTIPVLGSEVSTVFLIFTSITWSIIFGVIEGARSIPSEIKDVARMNGVTGTKYLYHVV